MPLSTFWLFSIRRGFLWLYSVEAESDSFELEDVLVSVCLCLCVQCLHIVTMPYCPHTCTVIHLLISKFALSLSFMFIVCPPNKTSKLLMCSRLSFWVQYYHTLEWIPVRWSKKNSEKNNSLWMRSDAMKSLNVCSDWKNGMKWVVEELEKGSTEKRKGIWLSLIIELQ